MTKGKNSSSPSKLEEITNIAPFRFPACCYLTSILYYNKLTSRFPGLKSIGSKVIPSGGVIDVVTLASSFGLSC